MKNMHSERPAYFRAPTWEAVKATLRALSDDELHLLLAGRPAKLPVAQVPAGREAVIEELVQYGGYLMVKLGLIKLPDLAVGTVFSRGGIEYIITPDVAVDIAEEKQRIDVRRLGEDKWHHFTYARLLRAISESWDFDQLDHHD
jgi:hypothetical protein